MRKYIRFSVLTIILILVGILTPQVIISLIPEVSLVLPRETEVSDDIYASGTVEEEVKQEILASLPLVPRSVLVKVGDDVRRGDVIAEIDAKATQQAIISVADSANLIPPEYQEYAEVFGKLDLNTAMLESVIPDKLIAPAGGTVTSLTLTKGAMVLPQTVVCTISQLDSLRVKMSVSEEDAQRISVKDKVVFKAVATGDEKYLGEIERIFPTAVKVLNGTSWETMVEFYVTPLNNTQNLRSGYTVNGAIKKSQGIIAVTIPYEAISQDEKNIEYVYVYENGKAVRRDIQTGTEFTDGAEIVSGIDKNDIVILNPAAVTKSGMYVRGEK